MSGGRARGHRLGWEGVPASVRDRTASALGSPVVAFQDQTGGFSPGCATRVRCADGTRAFVKAVGSPLNVDSPTLFRREVEALRLLGSHALWADLLASYDDGEWVILVLEDVDGKTPDLTDDAVMAQLLTATDELGRVMRERATDLAVRPRSADDERPPMFRPGPVDLRETFHEWTAALAQADRLPPDLVPRWVVERRSELADGARLLADFDQAVPVHYDIRDDNLLRRPDGRLVFLDWGAFGVGPDWLDPLLVRLERVEQPWFDQSLASSSALERAGDELVTSWLVAVGTHLAYRAHTHDAVNLPTLRAFRRTESARFLGAAARRLGIT